MPHLAQNAGDALVFNGAGKNASELVAYSDSNWAVAHSTTGWMIFLAGATIGYGSKRQKSISMSSTEAEVTAASTTALELLFFRGIMGELGGTPPEPTTLWVDNSGAVELAKHRKSCHKSRHIERRNLKVRELVAQGDIIVKFVPTLQNRADLLTKPLFGNDSTKPGAFKYHKALAMSQ